MQDRKSDLAVTLEMVDRRRRQNEVPRFPDADRGRGKFGGTRKDRGVGLVKPTVAPRAQWLPRFASVGGSIAQIRSYNELRISSLRDSHVPTSGSESAPEEQMEKITQLMSSLT